jgi:hypothetical protein
MFGVEMRHRHPVERCVKVGFHPAHHIPRQLLQVETLAKLW